MAKIMLGSLAGAISGAVGNDVYSHNRAGYYIRKRVIPTKVTNTYTLGARNRLAITSQAWGGLTEAQQAAWGTWAQNNPISDRLGQSQVLFGNAAYVQLNARLLQAGDAQISLPPVDSPPAPLLTFSAALGVGADTAILTFTATPLGANDRLWVQVAVVDNPGINYFKNLLKLVDVSAKAVVTGNDIKVPLQQRFGSMIEGQRFFMLASVFSSTTGLMSGPLLATGTVAA